MKTYHVYKNEHGITTITDDAGRLCGRFLNGEEIEAWVAEHPTINLVWMNKEQA